MRRRRRTSASCTSTASLPLADRRAALAVDGALVQGAGALHYDATHRATAIRN